MIKRLISIFILISFLYTPLFSLEEDIYEFTEQELTIFLEEELGRVIKEKDLEIVEIIKKHEIEKIDLETEHSIDVLEFEFQLKEMSSIIVKQERFIKWSPVLFSLTFIAGVSTTLLLYNTTGN